MPTLVNFWLDVCLLVLFCLLSWVSAVLQFVFPAGPNAFQCSLWGLNYLAWRDIQFGILCAFAFAVLLHVMFHWKWCCAVVTRRILGQSKLPDGGMQTIYGVVLLIIIFHLLGIGFAVALVTIQGVEKI